MISLQNRHAIQFLEGKRSCFHSRGHFMKGSGRAHLGLVAEMRGLHFHHANLFLNLGGLHSDPVTAMPLCLLVKQKLAIILFKMSFHANSG